MKTTLSTVSRLRQERVSRRWSLTHVTTLTGIASTSLSLIERGLVPAHPGWQSRIAQAFSMSPEDLFENKAVRPATETAA